MHRAGCPAGPRSGHTSSSSARIGSIARRALLNFSASQDSSDNQAPTERIAGSTPAARGSRGGRLRFLGALPPLSGFCPPPSTIQLKPSTTLPAARLSSGGAINYSLYLSGGINQP